MSTQCRSTRPSHRLITITTFSLTLFAWGTTPAIAQGSGRHAEHGQRPAASQPAETRSDPYPLDVCPVSGKKLGSMGDPVVKTIDGREVRFCCGGCIAKFEADKAGYWQQIDKAIIEAQMPFYPLATCPISGEELGEEMGDPVDYVYNNRLVRFCCTSCVSKFLRDPGPALAKLDKAVIAQQRAHYPLTTCLVSGEELGGEMGEPVERVYDNHLVRFCCKSCIKKLEQNPARFLGMLDEAWKKQGGPPKSAHAADDHEDHGRAGKEDHDGHEHDHDDHDAGRHEGGHHDHH